MSSHRSSVLLLSDYALKILYIAYEMAIDHEICISARDIYEDIASFQHLSRCLALSLSVGEVEINQMKCQAEGAHSPTRSRPRGQLPMSYMHA